MYYGIRDFPASTRGLLCFAEFLLRTYKAHKSATNALSSVRRFDLDYRFCQDAFHDALFLRWKRALPLTVRVPSRSATAMPLGVLEQLCTLAAACGPEGVTMASFMAVCFHSLARASTLLAGGPGTYDITRLPTIADAERRATGFVLLLKWDKTHQGLSQAYRVPLLPRPGSPACPVRALTRLLVGAGSAPREALLFATPSAARGAACRLPLTIPRARHWLRLTLGVSGRLASLFSLHSLRRGGCTLAYAGGAAVSELQALGGWRGAAVHLYHSSLYARQRAAEALTGTTNS